MTDESPEEIEQFEKMYIGGRGTDVFVINHGDYWSLHSDSDEELYDEPNIYYDEDDMKELYRILRRYFGELDC